MLLSSKAVRGYSIQATDGNAGSVEGLYFDDESWEVRHIVAKAGSMLANRRVLIVPEFVERTDRSARVVHACLTEEQVRHAPGATSDLPVADREEFARLDGHGARTPVLGERLGSRADRPGTRGAVRTRSNGQGRPPK